MPATETAIPARVSRFASFAASHGYRVSEVRSDEWIHIVEGERGEGLNHVSFYAHFSSRAGGFLGLTVFPTLGRMEQTKKLSKAETMLYVHGDFNGRGRI